LHGLGNSRLSSSDSCVVAVVAASNWEDDEKIMLFCFFLASNKILDNHPCLFWAVCCAILHLIVS
jgi:hypothetical protein